MRSREFIGHGQEHNVFRSTIDGWVLKKPRAATSIILRMLTSSPSEVIKHEIKFVEEKLHGDVMYPETKVFTVGHGYVIAQRNVEEDYSLDKDTQRQQLLRTGNTFLLDIFMIGPENFVSNQENLYCVDMMFGYRRPFTRRMNIEEITHLISRILGEFQFQRVLQKERSHTQTIQTN